MLNGFLGGLVLGGASSLLMYTTGKITGMSGILGSAAVFRPNDDKRWCWSYLTGLIVAGVILANVRPGSFSSTTTLSTGATIIAGVLCGFGTRLGSGCTSGHGICGIPRLSPRSLAAVGTFMGVAVVSSIICHSTPLKDYVEGSNVDNSALDTPALLVLPSLLVMMAIVVLFSNNEWLQGMLKPPAYNPPASVDWYTSVLGKTTPIEHATALVLGMAFGLGLGLSGMCNPSVVIAFLNFIDPDVGWNPTLAFVMLGGVVVNVVTFYYMSQQDHPPVLSNSKTKLKNVIKMKFHSDNMKIDAKLLVGSAMFGIGWGMGGICPGPGIVALGGHTLNSSIFMPALLVGMALQEVIYGDSLLSLSTWYAPDTTPPAARVSVADGAKEASMVEQGGSTSVAPLMNGNSAEALSSSPLISNGNGEAGEVVGRE